MTYRRQVTSRSNVIIRIGSPAIAVLIMAALLLWTSAASAGYTWTSTGGPSVSGVLCTAYDSANDIVYAGMSGGGVYKYESGTWTPTGGPSGSTVYSLCFDNVNNVLYAGAGDSVYRYQSGLWTPTANPSDGQVYALACDGADGVVFAGTSNGSVYRYSSGLLTPTGLTGVGGVFCMTMDTARNILYAGAGSRIVYKYDGSTWTPTGGQLGVVGGYVQSLAFDQERNILYTGLGLWSTGNVNVFRNEVGAGTGWVAIGALCASYNIYSLAVDDANNTLYANAYDGHVYKNCNASVGSTWIDMGAVSAGNMNILSYANGRNVLYSGNQDSNVYRTWIPVITLVEPATGAQGKTMDVVITGSNTDFTTSSTAVFSGDGVTVNSTTLLSANRVKANITINPLTYTGGRKVWVNTGGDKTNRLVDGFTITDGTPVISSISPENGSTGTEVTIKGTNFGASSGSSRVKFGAREAASYKSWSDAEIVATVPPGLSGEVNVTVVTAVGTSNAKKFTVTAPPVTTTWYLAEGTNAWGFNTYVTIENPNNKELHARLTYMDPNPTSGAGVVTTRTVTLPPLSQTSVSSTPDIGLVDFSTKVECLEGKSIAVDRTMFWTGQGAASPEGHNSVGVNAPSNTWYLPEGSCAWGFETWTLLQNPNATEATVTLTYMTEKAGAKEVQKKVPAHSRATYNMASDIGAADASIEVTSNVPVIAERSTYRNNRREGSCSIGSTTAATDYFLAEGTTAWGFTTYVLVQNPNNSDAQVTLTYMTPGGPVDQPAFTMPANSRKTIKVNDIKSANGYPIDVSNTDLSTQVHGSKPIIAERAMYWGAGTPVGEAMHDSIGLDSPHMTFYLPDGQTSSGSETWTLVQNPNPGAVTVRITYLPQGGGTPVSFTDEIPANTRSTYSMANKVQSGRASVLVESLDGARPIMVERSMYWNSRGAGTNTIGGFSD